MARTSDSSGIGDPPFIYIAAVRRTGSTLLCEALSEPPYSFVFNEPNLARRRCRFRAHEVGVWRERGIDLQAFEESCRGWRRYRGLRRFSRELVPQLRKHVHQIGVKEIFHSHWRRYLRLFPDMRVVVTARDPRDIYVSLHERWKRGSAIWSGPFTPERVARAIEEEFHHQQEMMREVPTFKVRYEDLCLDQRWFGSIKDFLGSKVPRMGEVGSFLKSDPRRVQEASVHDGRITERQVARWSREQDEAVLRAAEAVHGAMAEYCSFWGY